MFDCSRVTPACRPAEARHTTSLLVATPHAEIVPEKDMVRIAMLETAPDLVSVFRSERD